VGPQAGGQAAAGPGRQGSADPYARSGRRWALGAELVYRPIAAELVAMSPHPLAGRTVLDAGAGTGAVSAALAARHARPVATDLSAAVGRMSSTAEGAVTTPSVTRPGPAVAVMLQGSCNLDRPGSPGARFRRAVLV
jgi:hypothetical protein